MKIESSPVYLDTSALARIYLRETGSGELDAVLSGRNDLIVSDLAVTELTSALVRRNREGDISQEDVRKVYGRLHRDLGLEQFRRAEMTTETHREAERIILSLGREIALRAADALHLALAATSGSQALLTFDSRMREAAGALGSFELPGFSR